MRLTLGYSPCPNDTFIFEALACGRIDTGGITFDILLEDVQTLNEWAIEGRLDVSKVSYGVLPRIAGTYAVLDSGGALGRGVGPLLIAREPATTADFDWSETEVAIPGNDTTAHFLFRKAFPQALRKRFLRFDEIEDYVASGKGPGVIIHENRFTYQRRGLHLLMDLGQHWESVTGHAIPLGGIVARRSLGVAVHRQVNGWIRQSLDLAFSRYPELSDYVRCHAQEMEESVMRQHIDLYVNDFSRSMGEDGRQAILAMMEQAGTAHGLNAKTLFA